jgi:hypothetical protein
VNYLPGLASNHDPPDLCLQSSQDYRREPLVPGFTRIFLNECYMRIYYQIILMTIRLVSFLAGLLRDFNTMLCILILQNTKRVFVGNLPYRTTSVSRASF